MEIVFQNIQPLQSYLNLNNNHANNIFANIIIIIIYAKIIEPQISKFNVAKHIFQVNYFHWQDTLQMFSPVYQKLSSSQNVINIFPSNNLKLDHEHIYVTLYQIWIYSVKLASHPKRNTILDFPVTFLLMFYPRGEHSPQRQLLSLSMGGLSVKVFCRWCDISERHMNIIFYKINKMCECVCGCIKYY